MLLRTNDRQRARILPGLVHRTLAGAADGMRRLSVAETLIAPGARTAPHRHACEEVIVVLEGNGTLELGAERIPFGPRSTIIVPFDTVHRLINDGPAEIRLIAALSSAEAVVQAPDGRPAALP
ncbi:MAG: cupin domain-containing protein [Geminicoccaceae bacterium]